MMDKPPSPYPGARGSEPPGQVYESDMIHDHPQPSVQKLDPEIAYDYPHAAGFPQAAYPPTQQLYAQGYAGATNPTGSAEYTEYPGSAGSAGIPQDYPHYAGDRQAVNALNWKSRNTLWIVLTALALLVLLAAGSLYAYFLTRSTPAKTLQTYCSAIKNQDSHTLYDTYSKDAQTMTDEAHLQQGMRLIEFLSGGIEDCSVDSGSIHEDDPQATARVTFTLYNGRLTGAILHLIDENGQWKIENNAAIFP